MRNPLRPQWLKFIPLSCCQPRAPLLAFVPRRIATTTARNAAPVDLPELIVSPGSPRHNSLSTFLKWAERSQIEPSKTVFVGTHYEYMTALALRRLGFSLLRIGRRGDAGIDLIGHWILAPLQEPMPVIVQCKVRRISLNPSTIREMEGSFQGIPAGWNKAEVLGLIVTTQKATSGMLKALAHSRSALGFVLITRAGTIQQFVWNRAASERGLEGVGVTVRHTPRAMLSEAEADLADQDVPNPSKQDVKYKHAGTEKDIQLTWMGSPIFPERNDGTPETLEMFGQAVHGSNTYPHIDKRMDPSLKRCVGRNMTAEDAPSPRGGEIPRRAGRPPGAKNKAKLGESPPPLVTAERKAPAISAQPIRVSGRRGRPRKIKDTIKAGATVIVKRGRPRKIEHIEAVTVVPAKRGRPRKIECIEANTTVPAKRGRPPKTEHIEASTTMTAKRGRPKGSKNKRETLGEG